MMTKRKKKKQKTKKKKEKRRKRKKKRSRYLAAAALKSCLPIGEGRNISTLPINNCILMSSTGFQNGGGGRG